MIVLAENDPADQELARRALAEYPHECDLRVVPDGVALLDYLASANGRSENGACPPPDMIILDLNMPKKDGRQVLRELRQTESNTLVPIVVFSTSDDSRDVVECYRHGCNSYVTKPMDLKRFNEAMHMMVTYWLRLSKLP